TGIPRNIRVTTPMHPKRLASLRAMSVPEHRHEKGVVASPLPLERVTQPALDGESAGAVHGDRPHVEGVHVQPDPVQSDTFEGILQDELSGLSAQSLPGELDRRQGDTVTRALVLR